ncbi:hypothetical protein DMH04_51955 [Kibdelosporangium aridum]|uniref:HTH cro/C1-type domain-containing protein n=1 Tax=Kibdelosporangium aridum TaxID=2030 RepID=A0A428Y908_KIBAR|nr:hypothetical protein DMH04_51955 [Kibdelosporangium aridum]
MAGETPVPNYHGRKLLRELQKLRKQACMTQEEAGDRAHIEFKKLSRIERKQLPTYHELLILLDVYGVVANDYSYYTELLETARAKRWWTEYRLRDTRYIRMEDEAKSSMKERGRSSPWWTVFRRCLALKGRTCPRCRGQ